MRTVPIKLYAYSVLVLAVQAERSAKKEAVYRFRVIARKVDEAESIALELARLAGETREMIATANKIECLRGCHAAELAPTG
jgi:hypothetical protein